MLMLEGRTVKEREKIRNKRPELQSRLTGYLERSPHQSRGCRWQQESRPPRNAREEEREKQQQLQTRITLIDPLLEQ